MDPVEAVGIGPEPVAAEAVVQALARPRWPVVQSLQVAVKGGVVTLHGRVASYHEKQVVQRLVLGLPGVVQLNDDIQVTYGHAAMEGHS